MTWEFNASRVADVEAYRTIRDGIDSMEDIIDLSMFHMDEREVTSAVKAVVDDHPIFVHFSGSWSYAQSKGHVVCIMPAYGMSEQERRVAVQEIRTRCAEVVAPCMHLDSIDREMYILEWIRNNLLWRNSGDARDHSPEGALFGGTCVCDGISKATSLLLNMAGVDCSIVSKDTHCWNIVRLGDRCGHLDAGTVSWSDPSRVQTMINVPDEEGYGLDLGC